MKRASYRLAGLVLAGMTAALAPVALRAQGNFPPPPPPLGQPGGGYPSPSPSPAPTPGSPAPLPAPPLPPGGAPPGAGGGIGGGGGGGGDQGGGPGQQGGGGGQQGGGVAGGNNGGGAQLGAGQGNPGANGQQGQPDNGQSPAAATAQIDPGARDILQGSAAAYQKLTSYSDSVTVNGSSRGTSHVITGDVMVKKPSLARVTAKADQTTMHLVSNTNGIYRTSSDDTAHYFKLPASRNALAQVLFSSPTGGTGIVPLMLTEPNAYTMFMSGISSATVQASSTIGGVPVDVVQMVQAGSGGRKATTITISIGSSDHLVRKVVVDADQVSVTEVHSDVKANPLLTDASFAFTPPPGSRIYTPQPPGQVNTAPAAPVARRNPANAGPTVTR